MTRFLRQVTPVQLQWGVFGVHEERVWGFSRESLKESRSFASFPSNAFRSAWALEAEMRNA